MQFLLNILLFQDGLYIPLWIAVVSGVIALLTAGGGVWYYKQHKAKLEGENKGTQLKNDKQELENELFEDEVLDKAKTKIKNLNKEILDLESTCGKFERELASTKRDRDFMSGKVDEANEQRDRTEKSFREFEKAVEEKLTRQVEEFNLKLAGEQQSCEKKIEEVRNQMQNQIDDLQKQLEQK